MEKFTLEVAVDFVDQLLSENHKTGLSDVEKIIFQEAWKDLTYQHIADHQAYSCRYINDSGGKLWHKLSDITKKPLRMRQFKNLLQEFWQEKSGVVPSDDQDPGLSYPSLPYPGLPERVNSHFYIKPNKYELFLQELMSYGALIRIRAPKGMGKTSLMNRLCANAQQQNYRVVRLGLEAVDNEIFTSTESLISWLCESVSLQIELENQFVSTSIEACSKTTQFFEACLSTEPEKPLLLVLDKVDRLFMENIKIAQDFFGLLRKWYEEAGVNELWNSFNLLLVYSTECYVPMRANSSPFNVGYPVELEDLQQSGVERLVALHKLDWNESEIQGLMDLVGGHPYLIRIALYEATTKSISATEILQYAASEVGVFKRHLQELRSKLYANQELREAYKTVIASNIPVVLEPPLPFQLESLGLVKYHKSKPGVVSSYKLYQQYFQ